MRSDPLRQLARFHGIQHAYEDAAHQHQEASDETLLAMLRVLGVAIDGPAAAPAILRECRQEAWRRALEPVAVVWDGNAATIRLRLPAGQASGRYSARLGLETGEVRTLAGRLDELPTLRQREIEGVRYQVKVLTIAGPLPSGYHHLELQWNGQTAESLLLAAPRLCWQPLAAAAERLWGVFVPLYALHSQRSFGAGDFTDLEDLMHWVAAQGGRMVATLPLLSSLWELGADPSPYSPSSRLFWNELYLDPMRVPEFGRSPQARQLWESPEYRAAQADFRNSPHVDYGRLVQLKRAVLDILADAFFAAPGDGQAELESYIREVPDVAQFARFRAVTEQQGKSWLDWPEPLRSGALAAGDYQERVFRYHLYCQWQIERQLHDIAARADRAGLLWYLDFPLGVNTGGYDVWRNPDLFLLRAAGGAPPDPFFTKGQNWGFSPMHPQRMRAQGYRYWIDCLRRHLHHARVLRIDHVMCLYRLYCVPHGLAATEGAYLRYPTEELVAILSLESHRRQARVVGENLGTVPPTVDVTMQRHGILGMYVVPNESSVERDPPLAAVPGDEVASVNTHDMPPFASFWLAHDVDDRLALGLFDAAGAARERAARASLREAMVGLLVNAGMLDEPTEDAQTVLEALMAWLAASPAPVVLATLEDLWGETAPQNTPGTYLERPNWRRKLRLSLDEFRDRPTVRRMLAVIDRERRKP